MRKKIIIFLLVIFCVFISYEASLFIISKSNSSLIIGGQSKKDIGNAILYINNKEIDTINLDSHYSHIGKYNFSLGKNEILIKGIDTKIDYKTNLIFFGLYNWNLIEYTSDGFVKYKYYTKPTIM